MVTAVDPLRLWLPVQAPLAVQDAALPELQVRVEGSPAATVVGLALRASVGAGATVTLALRLVEPPAPVQLSV